MIIQLLYFKLPEHPHFYCRKLTHVSKKHTIIFRLFVQ